RYLGGPLIYPLRARAPGESSLGGDGRSSHLRDGLTSRSVRHAVGPDARTKQTVSGATPEWTRDSARATHELARRAVTSSGPTRRRFHIGTPCSAMQI